jgi:hypothetical protein
MEEETNLYPERFNIWDPGGSPCPGVVIYLLSCRKDLYNKGISFVVSLILQENYVGFAFCAHP